MNNTINVTETIAGMGLISSTSESTTIAYINGQNIDVKTKTIQLSLDQYQVGNLITQYVTSIGKPLFEQQIFDFLKDKVRFDMISWVNEEGVAECTCQLYFGDKLIDEKSTSTKGNENVNV